MGGKTPAPPAPRPGGPRGPPPAGLLTPAAGRSAETQALLQREAHYFKTHREHLHYQTIECAGAPIGSVAVESLGAQLQRRFRCSGQFWMRPGLSHLLALAVLFRNRDEACLWN